MANQPNIHILSYPPMSCSIALVAADCPWLECQRSIQLSTRRVRLRATSTARRTGTRAAPSATTSRTSSSPSSGVRTATSASSFWIGESSSSSAPSWHLHLHARTSDSRGIDVATGIFSVALVFKLNKRKTRRVPCYPDVPNCSVLWKWFFQIRRSYVVDEVTNIHFALQVPVLVASTSAATAIVTIRHGEWV